MDLAYFSIEDVAKIGVHLIDLVAYIFDIGPHIIINPQTIGLWHHLVAHRFDVIIEAYGLERKSGQNECQQCIVGPEYP